MTTFGYTSGDGTGSNVFGGMYCSLYVNTSGSTVYVDTVNLINITAFPNGASSAEVALYADLGGAPGSLLSATGSQVLTTGSNAFSLTAPISVGPGVGVWVAASTSQVVTYSGSGAAHRLFTSPNGFGSWPTPWNTNQSLGLILPATCSGSTTGPGHTTAIRAPLVLSEASTEGPSAPRIPLVLSEPLVEGPDAVRASLVLSEPLTEGNDHIRCSLLIMETLHAVPPEGWMSDAVFPTLRGLTYSVHKKPNYSTRISKNPSGREIRNSMYQNPIWDFELVYEWLPDRGAGVTDLKSMLGFFCERQGAFDTFLYQDPDDYIAAAQVIGVADGVTTTFTLLHSIGTYVEPIGQLNTGVSYDVKVGGVLQVLGTDYTVTMPNTIVFATAPPTGSITWDGHYYFVCRFSDDVQDYEKFMDSLWQLQKCDFQSVPQ